MFHYVLCLRYRQLLQRNSSFTVVIHCAKISDMGVKAVGTYLQTLRERQGLKPLDIVAKIHAISPELNTNPTYLWRIENGKIHNPGARVLFAFASAVQANLDHIALLLFDERPDDNDARFLAQDWLFHGIPSRNRTIEYIKSHDSTVFVPFSYLDEISNPRSKYYGWSGERLQEFLVQIALQHSYNQKIGFSDQPEEGQRTLHRRRGWSPSSRKKR